LWRMHASELEFFSQVRLPHKHAERLRSALLSDDPLQPLEYPCSMCAAFWDGKFHRDGILPPTVVRANGFHHYRVVISGIVFAFFVASHMPPEQLQPFFISPAGEFLLMRREAREIPFLAHMAMELGSAIRQRNSVSVSRPGKK
jgi:hypothetical protein